MVILKFDGVDTMNEVEGWRQKDLLITKRSGDPAGGGRILYHRPHRTYCCHGRGRDTWNFDGCDGDRSK